MMLNQQMQFQEMLKKNSLKQLEQGEMGPKRQI